MLRPENLPPDVTAAIGYDHRGHCYQFDHKQLGELGRIVLIEVGGQEMQMQAELYQGPDKPESPTAKKRKAVFEQVVATVNADMISQSYEIIGRRRRKAPLHHPIIPDRNGG